MKKILISLLVLLCGCSQTNPTITSTGGSEQVKIAILYDEEHQKEAKLMIPFFNSNGYISAQKEITECNDDQCVADVQNYYDQHVDVFVSLGGYPSDVLNELKNTNNVPVFTIDGNWDQFYNYQKDITYENEANLIKQLLPDLAYMGVLEKLESTLTKEDIPVLEEQILEQPIDGIKAWYYTQDIELIKDYDFEVPLITIQAFEKALVSFEYDENEMIETVTKDVVSYLKNEPFETDVFSMKPTIYPQQIEKYELDIPKELTQYLKK